MTVRCCFLLVPLRCRLRSVQRRSPFCSSTCIPFRNSAPRALFTTTRAVFRACLLPAAPAPYMPLLTRIPRAPRIFAARRAHAAHTVRAICVLLYCCVRGGSPPLVCWRAVYFPAYARAASRAFWFALYATMHAYLSSIAHRRQLTAAVKAARVCARSI